MDFIEVTSWENMVKPFELFIGSLNLLLVHETSQIIIHDCSMNRVSKISKILYLIDWI